ncbi:MAG: cupin domain-containing protein [Pseudomonadota bacterium]
MGREPEPAREFFTRERCWITEILNDPSQPQVSVARARVEPGVTTELHALGVLEWYVIEAGAGRVFVGEQAPRDVRPGDTIRIPAGAAQKICNTGDSDLLFLCVCVPRFSAMCYTAL